MTQTGEWIKLKLVFKACHREHERFITQRAAKTACTISLITTTLIGVGKSGKIFYHTLSILKN